MIQSLGATLQLKETMTSADDAKLLFNSTTNQFQSNSNNTDQICPERELILSVLSFLPIGQFSFEALE